MEHVLEHREQLLQGMAVTIETALAILALCTLLGFLVAGARLVPVTKAVAFAYTEFFQNIPYPILVFFMYYALPEAGVTLDPIMATILGVSLYSSAYVAEALRSGVLAVPKGHLDAGYATGLSRFQVIRSIVLKQAVVYALPSLTNQWCRALRNVSVMAIIGGQEILFEASQLADRTFEVIAFYTIAGVAYWLLSIPITALSGLAERISLRRRTGATWRWRWPAMPRGRGSGT
ncbi:MAG: amino acid ABC transporter permease [Burkholderiaceae bacterium]|nr:amino acid ABC transporter permease [Burkholderiaceae bacterium]